MKEEEEEKEEIIHGHKINYLKKSIPAANYMHHLEYSLSREEVESFMHEAKHDPHGKVHLEDHHGNKLTMVYDYSTGKYLVRDTLY